MSRSVWAEVVFVSFVVVTYSTGHGFAVVVSRSFERGGRLRRKSAVYLVAVLLFFAAFIVSAVIGESAFGLPEPLGETPQTIRQAVASGLLLLACAGILGSLFAVAASALPARSPHRSPHPGKRGPGVGSSGQRPTRARRWRLDTRLGMADRYR